MECVLAAYPVEASGVRSCILTFNVKCQGLTPPEILFLIKYSCRADVPFGEEATLSGAVNYPVFYLA